MQSKHFIKIPGIFNNYYSQCAHFYIFEHANSKVAAPHNS